MTTKLLPSAWRNWGATAAEVSGPMSGDVKVPNPNYDTTLAVTIDAAPADVWPWLVQLGYRRGGLYSYDWLDRLFGYLDRPSAERILPEFQQLAVGDAIPVGRGAAFPVSDLKPNRCLVMTGMEAGFAWSWEFALCPLAGRRTRLISRNRARMPETMGSRLFMLLLEPPAFLMTRKMLLGIKRRAEAPAPVAIPAGIRRVPRSVRATRVEQTDPLPADEIINEPLGSLTHAITIRGSKGDVWPWLVQMGAGRAGWYSYDFVDNGGRRSSRQILAPLQSPAKGTVFPGLPGATDGFVLIDYKPAEWLVLGWPDPHGRQIVTWAFVLRNAGPSCTRLVVRAKGSASYRFHGLPSSIGLPLARLVHFVMQRKQLLGIANRVERSGARKSLERGVLALASLVAFGFVGYGAYAGITWFRYGRIDRPVTPHEIDPLLDRFIPVYETAERHHIRVHAPAAITLEAAKASDMNDSAVVRAIFETREIVFRATPDDTSRPRGILAQMRAIGWGVLAEIPDREIVMGAVTQPWKGDVVFRALPPDEFASFHEPGYVKIVWTLRADALGPAESMAITETRVTNTDAFARENFRRYWAFVSPGVVLIRHMSLRLVRRDAEQRYRAADKTTVKIVPPDGGTSM